MSELRAAIQTLVARWAGEVAELAPPLEVSRVTELLQSLPAEQNQVTRKFAVLGLQADNALQSQGLIGLYGGKCSLHHCLQCPVGSSALGKNAGNQEIVSAAPRNKRQKIAFCGKPQRIHV